VLGITEVLYNIYAVGEPAGEYRKAVFNRLK